MRPVPGYWMHETGPLLRGAVNAYLRHEPLTPGQLAAMRLYLRQWMAGDWQGPGVAELRADVDTVTSRPALAAWLGRALALDIDPL